MRGRQGILDEPYVGTVSLKLPQSDKADEVILVLKRNILGIDIFSWILW